MVSVRPVPRRPVVALRCRRVHADSDRRAVAHRDHVVECRAAAGVRETPGRAAEAVAATFVGSRNPNAPAQRPGGQLTTIVITDCDSVALAVPLIIRNRCPSGDTSYPRRLEPRVVNPG